MTDAILAERSKAVRSGRTIFGCVSSNLTDCMLLILQSFAEIEKDAGKAFNYALFETLLMLLPAPEDMFHLFTNTYYSGLFTILFRFQLHQPTFLDRLPLAVSFLSHFSKNVAQSLLVHAMISYHPLN